MGNLIMLIKYTNSYTMDAGYVTKKAMSLLRKLHNYTIGATEFSGCSAERADGILFRLEGSTLIETKITRSDFKADAKKEFRSCGSKGIGQLRYYACPEDLIKPEELPEKWGLIYVYPKNKAARLIVGYGGSFISKGQWPKCIYENQGDRDFKKWHFDKACLKLENKYLYFLAKRYKEQSFMDNIL